MPGDPTPVLASMSNYLFTTELLIDVVTRDAANDSASHDIGGDIIPLLVDNGAAHARDFTH